MGYYNLFVLSFGYMITLLAYNTAQNFLTTLFGQNGFIALSIVYISFALSTTVTASIVKCGPRAAKWSAIVANLGYTVFLGSCALACYLDPSAAGSGRHNNGGKSKHEETKWILYIGASIVGFTGALAWTAQGSILSSAASSSQMGLFSGIFLCIFQLNAIFGSVLSGVMQYLKFDDWLFYMVLLCVCLVGNIVLLFLKAPLPASDGGSINMDVMDVDGDGNTRLERQRLIPADANLIDSEESGGDKDATPTGIVTSIGHGIRNFCLSVVQSLFGTCCYRRCFS